MDDPYPKPNPNPNPNALPRVTHGFRELSRAFPDLKNACKAPDVRVCVEATVQGINKVSKNLCFVDLLERSEATLSPASMEVIVKVRDGFFTPVQVGHLAGVLTQGDRVRVVGFPEGCLKENGLGTRQPSANDLPDHGCTICLHAVIVSVLSREDPGEVLHHLPAPDLMDAAPATAVASSEAPVEGADDNEAPSRADKPSRNRKVDNKNRGQRFSSWLLEEFGYETLMRGCGVLDVAGGSGELSFDLACKYHIPCTVVDPRPLNFKQKQLTWIRNQQRRLVAQSPRKPSIDQGAGAGASAGPTASGGAHKGNGLFAKVPDAVTSLNYILMGNEQNLLCGEADSSDSADPGRVLLEIRSKCRLRSAERLFDDDFVAAEPTASVWQDCSVVVGMHPDEATEPIVDHALASGKPFAVVPCCVFPNKFPGRRIRGLDGSEREVRSYDDFCEYLLAKDSRVLESVVPAMEGRTRVLYSRGRTGGVTK